MAWGQNIRPKWTRRELQHFPHLTLPRFQPNLTVLSDCTSYWDRNWQVKHLRLRKHQLTISQVSRLRSTAQPHGIQIGRVLQSF